VILNLIETLEFNIDEIDRDIRNDTNFWKKKKNICM